MVLCFTAFGQTNAKQDPTEAKQSSITNNSKMNISKLTNQTVKNAFDALQAGDKNTFYSCFANNATFTDDGRTLDFKSFFDNAFEKKEKFLTLDKVENEGKDLYGNFYAGQWGTFKVYFKFHLNGEGKINRLDIGQAN